MKVGILTFYFADNYGAVLQCWALQESCRRLGCEVQVINYLPRKMIPYQSRLKQLFFKTKCQKLFGDFRKANLLIKTKRNKLDVLIVGSDQVWNLQIIGYDSFWIKPKIQYKKLCSYAASLGKEELSEREKYFFTSMKTELKSYSSCTVREQSGQEQLKKIGIESSVVCDPTLLLYNQSECYDELAEKSNYHNLGAYILVYSLEHSDTMDKIIKEKQGENGFKVICLHPYNEQMQACDQFLKDAGPYDFLYLIKNSLLVITNSFHGLAFSYIFRKTVYSVNHSALSVRQLELIIKSGFQYTKIAEDIYYINTDQTSERMKCYLSDSQKKLGQMVKTE